ncbi:hypothetical protein R6Q59_005094 [Mikania micrantha]
MAISSSSSFAIIRFLWMLLLMTCNHLHATLGCYTSIISLGDSLADTGNLKQLTIKSNSPPPHFLFPPYGETFFHNPTAESFGMPLIPPYEVVKRNGVIKKGQGVNFAVAGATALDSWFHEAHGVVNQCTNASLVVVPRATAYMNQECMDDGLVCNLGHSFE